MPLKTEAHILKVVLSDGLVSGEYVFCPVYDWKISLVNGQVQAPDEGQVKVYLQKYLKTKYILLYNVKE